jgi:hypothetical protein
LATGSVLVTAIDQALIVTRILQPPFFLWKGGLGGEEIIENTQAARSGKNKTRLLDLYWSVCERAPRDCS